jgi:hypothetical protein
MVPIAFSESVARKLPFLMKSGRIFFVTTSGKTSCLYTKHAISFPNNLMQALDDLKRGSLIRVWFDSGLVGHVEVWLGIDGKLEGVFTSDDEKSIAEFQKVLKTD